MSIRKQSSGYPMDLDIFGQVPEGVNVTITKYGVVRIKPVQPKRKARQKDRN